LVIDNGVEQNKTALIDVYLLPSG